MSTNRTLPLSLLTRCQQIFKNTRVDITDQQGNTTPSSTTYNLSLVSKAFTRETYDNAYLYILFVMLFYSVLATTLFKCFISSDGEETDSDEEFVSNTHCSTQTLNSGHMEKFYFEEENSL